MSSPHLEDPPLPQPAPQHSPPAAPAPRKRWRWARLWVPLTLLGLTGAVIASNGLLLRHAEASVDQRALADEPRPVTAVPAKTAEWRPQRRYVGTLEPLQRAAIGPQIVSAYVESVAVRPGDAVHKGDELARLDCRFRTANREAATAQSRALTTRQREAAREAARLQGVDRTFVADAELEQKAAISQALQAQVAETKANIAAIALAVDDCVLRAPFDGEISARLVDPGTFVRPGQEVLTLVDRSTVRVTAAVPETEFAAVAPGKEVDLRFLASQDKVRAPISRRAPAADPATRNVAFELDLPNRERALPIGTTVELLLQIGDTQPALQLPVVAASMRGDNATVFSVDKGKARRRVVPVLGERDGLVFVKPDLPPETPIITEGRALVHDGDAVLAQIEQPIQRGAP